MTWNQPAEIIAALSALIFQEKSDSELDPCRAPRKTEDYSICEAMKKIALNFGQVQNEHGLMIDQNDYCESSRA